MISLQLAQFNTSPFFGIVIISLSHSSGIFTSFYIFLNRGYSISTVISGSTFSTSGFILSRPDAFPFSSNFRASYISVFVGGSKFTSVSFSFSLVLSFNISHFLLAFCFLIILVEYFGKLFLPSLQLFLCC